MSEKYRVVLTCWDYGTPEPYSDDLSGTDLSLFSTEALARKGIEECVRDEFVTLNNSRKKEPVYDSDGHIVGHDYPFRADFDGEHNGIVRFWDGDDYQEVTAYNIYPLSCDSDDLDKCSYYNYRGFYVIPNEAHTSFRVEQFDTALFRFKSLQKALREIDRFALALSLNAPARKSSLMNQIQSATARSVDFHTSSGAPAKKTEPER